MCTKKIIFLNCCIIVALSGSYSNWQNDSNVKCQKVLALFSHLIVFIQGVSSFLPPPSFLVYQNPKYYTALKGTPPEITKYRVGRLQKMTESKPWFCERIYSFGLSRSRGLPVHSLVFRTLWAFGILCWQKLGVGKNNETYYITHIPKRIIAHGSVLHPGLQEKNDSYYYFI